MPHESFKLGIIGMYVSCLAIRAYIHGLLISNRGALATFATEGRFCVPLHAKYLTLTLTPITLKPPGSQLLSQESNPTS